MSTEMRHINVIGIRIEIVKKPIKNLHLGVYPPNGRVRVAAPPAVKEDAVRLAVVTRLPWIRKRQAAFARQERQSARRYVSGESHFVFGRRYRLSVVSVTRAPGVAITNARTITLCSKPRSTQEQREKVMLGWYRKILRDAARSLIETWAGRIGIDQPQWGIRRMKTKWGSCSTKAKRIWLNLELAKKPPQCLEYIIVHELSHLIERKHNDRFLRLMDRHLPEWRTIRDELNAAPLSHEEWYRA